MLLCLLRKVIPTPVRRTDWSVARDCKKVSWEVANIVVRGDGSFNEGGRAKAKKTSDSEYTWEEEQVEPAHVGSQ